MFFEKKNYVNDLKNIVIHDTYVVIMFNTT